MILKKQKAWYAETLLTKKDNVVLNAKYKLISLY